METTITSSGHESTVEFRSPASRLAGFMYVAAPMAWLAVGAVLFGNLARSDPHWLEWVFGGLSWLLLGGMLAVALAALSYGERIVLDGEWLTFDRTVGYGRLCFSSRSMPVADVRKPRIERRRIGRRGHMVHRICFDVDGETIRLARRFGSAREAYELMSGPLSGLTHPIEML